MADNYITDLNPVASVLVTDLMVVETDPGGGAQESKKITIADMGATAAEVTTGTDPTVFATPKAIKDAGIIAPVFASTGETSTATSTTKAVTPKGLGESRFGNRIIEIALNGPVNLALTDKAYFRVPAIYDGWYLVAVAAMCKTCTTHAHVSLKNGATSMLSTDISIEDGEFDTSTSATPPVVDVAHHTVNTGNQLELACTTAGAAVTYFVVELQFSKP
jgi:hypothetical protein